jgi:putative DNA primase/helicase
LNARTGNAASSTNPKTWSTFDQAVTAYTTVNGYDGIGLTLTPDTGLVGIDLDHCRNPDSGDIAAWTQDISGRMQAYTEVSPSGEGLRLFAKATLPPQGRKKADIEMYNTGRYFTVTGCHLEGTPLTIESRQAEVDALHREVWPEHYEPRRSPVSISPEGNGATFTLSDDEIIVKTSSARNGDRFNNLLWYGDWKGRYPSQSEADMALCGHLAFWTRKNAEQMDRLLRQSGLHREKWDELRGEQTYGKQTIAEALRLPRAA